MHPKKPNGVRSRQHCTTVRVRSVVLAERISLSAPETGSRILAVFTYKGVDHIALVTRKLAAMKTFYMENLGMTLEHEGKAKAGYNVVTLRAGEALIDLFEASPTNPAPTTICHRIKYLRRNCHIQAQRDGSLASGGQQRIERQRAFHLGTRSGRSQDRNQDGLNARAKSVKWPWFATGICAEIGCKRRQEKPLNIGCGHGLVLGTCPNTILPCTK
jgi:catechol 2,3-dioxygenase-like lactoylglutathione lyase family enzyme